MVVNTIEFIAIINDTRTYLLSFMESPRLVAVYYENTIIIMYVLHSLYNNISRNWFSSHTAVDWRNWLVDCCVFSFVYSRATATTNTSWSIAADADTDDDSSAAAVPRAPPPPPPSFQ